MMLLTLFAITLPLYPLLGTVLLWGLLPFMLLAVAALWWGFQRNNKDAEVLEELSCQDDILTLSHSPARGATKHWECNVYWVRPDIHLTGGPVPYYITLTGNGRTVEIGSFLSEDERKVLYSELCDLLKDLKTVTQ